MSAITPFVGSDEFSMANFNSRIEQSNKYLNYQCNPNLLDNWCFLPGCVANQRGQTSYSPDYGYSIDRFFSNGFSVALGEDGLTLTETTWPRENLFFIERMDEGIYNALVGKLVTGSALVVENGALKLYSGTAIVPTHGAQNAELFAFGSLACRLFCLTLERGLGFYPTVTTRIGAHKLIAVKLELGDQQTLAHQDADGNWVLNEIPNYAEQLARCQRYYQLYSSASLRPTLAVDCRPTMRANPTQSTISIDNTTYYYNSAEL